MFTDLTDSTAMTTRLGEAKALHLLHVHNALTRNALREHAGREIKHLGDGIMASFASVDHALNSAVAIQKAFAEYNDRNVEIALHLRIGLSVGEPVEDDHDLFGVTVQLASRLCAHAEADQILATEEVVKPSTREKSQFSSVGSITLKGFDYSVPIYEVLWHES